MNAVDMRPEGEDSARKHEGDLFSEEDVDVDGMEEVPSGPVSPSAEELRTRRKRLQREFEELDEQYNPAQRPRSRGEDDSDDGRSRLSRHRA